MSGVDLERRVETVDLVELARRDGYEGFVAGEELIDNPFTNDELREAWKLGWEEARGIHHHDDDAWLGAP